MRPIVVLGAAGFVGRALVRRLTADGNLVIAVTRRAADLGPAVTTIAAGDLARNSDWSRSLEGAAAVVHLASAANARGAGVRIDEWIEAETEVARHVAIQIARARVPRAILLSSILVHGESTTGAPFRADQPLAPARPYARAKVCVEETMRAVLGTSGTALAILRPPLVYGPEVGIRFQMLLRLVRRSPMLPFASLHGRRSLIYRENLVDLLSHILSGPTSAQGAYVVRDDDELTTAELTRRLGAALGHAPILLSCPPILLRAAGHMLGCGEIVDRLVLPLEIDDRASRLALGWAPPHSVDVGISATCRWFLDRERCGL
jgi:nucleoside-diphosphate-sugar epimerase